MEVSATPCIVDGQWPYGLTARVDFECTHRCLGYTKNEATDEWDNTNVFPKWREKYPNPPDLIGKNLGVTCVKPCIASCDSENIGIYGRTHGLPFSSPFLCRHTLMYIMLSWINIWMRVCGSTHMLGTAFFCTRVKCLHSDALALVSVHMCIRASFFLFCLCFHVVMYV